MARFADEAHEKFVRENKPATWDILAALHNVGRSPDELLKMPHGKAKFEAHFWALQAGLIRGYATQGDVVHELTDDGDAFIRQHESY